MINNKTLLFSRGMNVIAGAPEGYDSLILSHMAKDAVSANKVLLYVAPNDKSIKRISDGLQFFEPELDIISIPAWDCLPYDRISPNSEIIAKRLNSLIRLGAGLKPKCKGCIVLTTVNSMLQRIPTRKVLDKATLTLRKGMTLSLGELSEFLNRNGYRHGSTVRELGEFAIRGGIVDIYSSSLEMPVRLDFFGDEIERIRTFDAITQRTCGKRNKVVLMSVCEVMLAPKSISLFRDRYRSAFGVKAINDPIYEAISAGHGYAGMEHWLPMFHDELDTVFDSLPNAIIILDSEVENAVEARIDQVNEFFEARSSLEDVGRSIESDGAAYRPIERFSLFLTHEEWVQRLTTFSVFKFSKFAATGTQKILNAGGRQSLNFSEARAKSKNIPGALFEAVRNRLIQNHARSTLVAANSTGSRDRLAILFREHGISIQKEVANWKEFIDLPVGSIGLGILNLESGFSTDSFVVYSEQDILGDRLIRSVPKRRRGEEFISEISSLGIGDIVVHIEHGIGRYDGLERLEISNAPHDCLRILYSGDDKLYVPVENIEILSRYGSEEAKVQLDRLGGVAWQARKARIKERIRDIAKQLLQVAAERTIKQGVKILPEAGIYEEFCSRFQWSETEHQLESIADVVKDFSSGQPMDRLICGDVGYGKTEIALRATFLASMAGYTVAVIVPTTLLARQHFATFSERFSGLPINIAQLSRFISKKEATLIKDKLSKGEIDIVIGTQSLFSESIKIPKLGLLIIDEEQHFGVVQKERLKQLKSNVHVLSLTATPIPRTLQMALSGVKEMSIISTPPVDRLAVRTFVLPYDSVVIREAIYREKFRGGQCFYVCPRVSDIQYVRKRIIALVPDVKIAVAHGRMSSNSLEKVMEEFCNGRIDLLLCTNIIESGLDIPGANTIIIHRADMFGLSQLYQLRGRVGRSKLRAYAYFTVPQNIVLTEGASRRLSVMQTLDSLGAGFSLASHDLDIRGAGNLLGDEQSGHIKEIGVELYQHMLEEAVASARGSSPNINDEDSWTPQITMGTPVLIPDDYVADLTVRLNLYRRASSLTNRSEIDAFAAELIDRFGALPNEVENLLQVIAIKQLCYRAGIERVEAGFKGVVLSFRGNKFDNPEGLVEFIKERPNSIKLRPEQLVYICSWQESEDRVRGVRQFIGELAALVDQVDKQASFNSVKEHA